METHSQIGEGILAEVEGYGEIAKIVRHHHERWDGAGVSRRLERRRHPAHVANRRRRRGVQLDDI